MHGGARQPAQLKIHSYGGVATVLTATDAAVGSSRAQTPCVVLCPTGPGGPAFTPGQAGGAPGPMGAMMAAPGAGAPYGGPGGPGPQQMGSPAPQMGGPNPQMSRPAPQQAPPAALAPPQPKKHFGLEQVSEVCLQTTVHDISVLFSC